MRITFYTPSDYDQLNELYAQTDQFLYDSSIDTKEALQRKIARDSESILLLWEDDVLRATVTFTEDGRLMILFRLMIDPNISDKHTALELLYAEVSRIGKERGYARIECFGPIGHMEADLWRIQHGFERQKDYSWFSKSI